MRRVPSFVDTGSESDRQEQCRVVHSGREESGSSEVGPESLRESPSQYRIESEMRKLSAFLDCLGHVRVFGGFAFDRQPGADYHSRREALAKKAGGVVVLLRASGGHGRGVRISPGRTISITSPGVTEPGAALLVAPAVEAKGDFRPAPTPKFFFCLLATADWKNSPARKLGAENPDAPKMTGFDRVEEMSEDCPRRLPKSSAMGGLWSIPTSPPIAGTSASAEPLAFLAGRMLF